MDLPLTGRAPAAERLPVLAFFMLLELGVLFVLKTGLLFVLTSVAEILGCYLGYLWLRKGAGAWVLLPAAMSLAVFVWLLSLHPTESASRVYAAYGGAYVAVALFWLWWVEGLMPTRWDVIGALVALAGMAIIVLGDRSGQPS